MENCGSLAILLENPFRESNIIQVNKKFQFVSKGGAMFNLVSFKTVSDGNCLIHAFLNAFSSAYRDESLDGKTITREKMAERVRNELSDKLDELDETGKTTYQKLCNGNLEEFSKYFEYFDKSNMQKILKTKQAIGYGFFELISKVFRKDIHILYLNKDTLEPYPNDENTKGNFGTSVIIFYHNHHYETVGLETPEGYITHFKRDNELVKAIYN